MRALNLATVDLIKRCEGLRETAYRDAVGVWTIGYGHTSAAGPPPVRAGMVMRAPEAEAVLVRDLERCVLQVQEFLHVPLGDNQFGALVSFVYNVGIGAASRSSVFAYVTARRFSEVPSRLALWNKAGGQVLAGLTKRRAAEGVLFARPDVEVVA